MNDLGAPHNKTVIVTRGSEMALANYDKGQWWFGPTYLSLKERIDFIPTAWQEVGK